MGKEKSCGIIIISWFEMIIGIFTASIAALLLVIDFLMYIIAGIHSNYINEFNEYKTVAVIFMIVFSLIFLAGRLTNKLNPIGRILNIYLSIFYILIYSYAYYRSGDSIKYLFNPFAIGILGWFIYYAPIILSVCFLIFFNNPNVKEQFK
ncbi:MAG: hypothetical protein WCY09_06705 [Candidatus Omnitrophota bacterium]